MWHLLVLVCGKGGTDDARDTGHPGDTSGGVFSFCMYPKTVAELCSGTSITAAPAVVPSHPTRLVLMTLTQP